MAAPAVIDADRVALSVDGGDDLTYGAWAARSNAVARGLADRGVGPGSRVGVLFDGRCWADFAVARSGVSKAGGVAVLLSPGAASADLARALVHSGAIGLICGSHVARPAVSIWAAGLAEVEGGQDTAAVPSVGPAEPADLAELVYLLAPLAPCRPWRRTHADVTEPLGPAVDGWLVHAWAPGSAGGHYALRVARAGCTSVVTLAVFDPDRFCALVEERRAATCGLTPALAAAVLASGAAGRRGVSSVIRVVLSGPPSAALRAGLQAAFPGATVTELTLPAAPGDGAALAPVAASQEGMLWHEQFTPGSFNLPCLVRRYQGPLDVPALQWALSELVRRHQPLRSTFALVDGRPGQVVADPSPAPASFVDLAALGAGDRDEEVARVLADATGRPFDLTTGPLFAPQMLRLGPDNHLLVVRLHHTVFDDWSVDVFRREISALYTARVAGAPSPLAEPSTSFADHARRRRARLAGGRDADQRAWWRHELAGGPLAVQLPLAGRDPAPTGPRPGEPLRRDLPPALVAGLRALSPRLRATPFMTVLAAFSVLVARVTGQDDLVMATVVAHRDETDVEPLIGCFSKKVPLRLRVDGDVTFAELVGRTRTSLLGAISHQEVAFDAAVQEALGGSAADHGVVPQVAVVFQGETPQRVRLTMPQLTVGPYEVRAEARWERHFSSGPDPAHPADDAPEWGDGAYLGTFLILSLLETTDGLALVARGIFDRSEAQRLLEAFELLLADVVAAPARPVSSLAAAAAVAGPASDTVELRGFRVRPSRLEGALAGCPGVADVAVAVREDDGGEPRLVAYVVAGSSPAPTLAQLRRHLWATLPGALWPADSVVVDTLHRLPGGRLDVEAMPPPDQAGTDPEADVLTAMWGEISGRPADTRRNYWQDFSFLQALAEAREAGLVLADETVARCRTPEMLAAARGAGSGV